MLISYRHQFLFVHIPKTAGVSVDAALRPFADNTAAFFENRLLSVLGIHVNHFTSHRRKLYRRHTSAETVRKNIPAEVFDGLFKFAFVRNPWDKLVSQYHYIRKTSAHHNHRSVSKMEFHDFVDRWTRSDKSRQRPFVCDAQGNLIVDYVGRFEHLERDFEEITRRIGVPCGLSHANSTKHRDYRTYYDRHLVRMVSERLADEIEWLGYTFDGQPAEISRAG